MQVHPTRASVDIAIASLAAMAVALIIRQAAVLAWAGALVVGLALARAVTRIGVSRIRAAGFEMLWRGTSRMSQVAHREPFTLHAELRNRDSRAARFTQLRCVCSPALRVRVEPSHGEVPAQGRMEVLLHVSTPRVGRHGVFGLSLEVQGSPGLFEVPLTFANPFGVEVLPRPFAALARSARGGRSRAVSTEGHAGPLAGDGSELRELREHQPGDAFKRIAWKASARRGELLVRDYEREERDVVWVALDASIELWSGMLGQAPLDHAIDEVASVAQRHLARGDSVGLLIVGSRILCRIDPGRGKGHLLHILSELSQRTDCVDSDRSDLDESDVAVRILEHMRPLDPLLTGNVRSKELDRIARRVDRVRARAPFKAEPPYAPNPRERTLRRYLRAFGIGSPPRLEPDRPRTDQQLAQFLLEIAHPRCRPSAVYIWSSPPHQTRPGFSRALVELRRRRVDVRWVSMRLERGIFTEPTTVGQTVADSISMRERAALRRGEQALRQLGVRVERIKSPHYQEAG